VAAGTMEVVTETDGIVFIRAGSGGRTDFGAWVSPDKPAWSAFRDNTHAIFLKLNAGANSLRVTAVGLDANGKKVDLDRVEIH
jgi:hypothetical protein